MTIILKIGAFLKKIDITGTYQTGINDLMPDFGRLN
jgi:hypothetical protein